MLILLSLVHICLDSQGNFLDQACPNYSVFYSHVAAGLDMPVLDVLKVQAAIVLEVLTLDFV